jgi:hypothetical protein
MLLERARLDPVTAIERLAGMQAQYPPAPYIGLWSRLQDFRREDLESAIKGDRVLKATLMRATLHLVSARTFSAYRLVAPDPYTVYTNTARLLRQHGLDPAAARRRVRERVLAVVRKRPVSRAELGAIVREETGDGVPLPNPAGWGAAAAYGDLISVVDDALFVFPREAHHRLAPPAAVEKSEALRRVAEWYLAAFGPASRADLAQWSGQTSTVFAVAFDVLDLVTFEADDGRTLFDLRAAPRPDPDVEAPVRFLPRWDNLLLAHDRRQRVLPDAYRQMIIRNGMMFQTFLVDGLVAGAWEAPLRGKAALTLRPMRKLSALERAEVEEEGIRLLSWLRPDTERRDLRWEIEV